MQGLHVRWMVRRDLPAVMQIEQDSFENGWDEEDFLKCLRERNCIAMVAEVKESILGYMVYELHKDHIALLNMAVGPLWRKQGVGAAMVDKLVSKLSSHRRRRIVFDLRETNLNAQLFFSKQGFIAINLDRGHFEDTGEDAYRMQYYLPDLRVNKDHWQAPSEVTQ